MRDGVLATVGVDDVVTVRVTNQIPRSAIDVANNGSYVEPNGTCTAVVVSVTVNVRDGDTVEVLVDVIVAVAVGVSAVGLAVGVIVTNR